MTKSRVTLPRGVRGGYEVYVNGVPQQLGTDYTVREGALVFERELRKDKISGWRWLLGAWGVGTYRQDDSVDVRDVPLDAGHQPFGRGREGRLGAVEHHRVALDVDDPAARVDRLRVTVGIAERHHAAADVEELPDPGVGGQVANHAAAEGAGGGRKRRDRRRRLDQGGGRPAVGREVGLPAVQEVVRPGGVGHGDVDQPGPDTVTPVMTRLRTHVAS